MSKIKATENFGTVSVNKSIFAHGTVTLTSLAEKINTYQHKLTPGGSC